MQPEAVAAKPAPYMPTKAAVEDWTTPEEVLDPVRRIFGGEIDFDPCSNPSSIVRAKQEVWLPKWLGMRPAPPVVTAEALALRPELVDRVVNPPVVVEREAPQNVLLGDGLVLPWSGNAFVNPPYDAKTLSAFMARAKGHADSGDSAILLCKSKTGLKGWHRAVPAAPAVCFLEGRLVFGGGDGESAPFDCALILWTQDRELVHRFAWYLDGKLGDVMFHR